MANSSAIEKLNTFKVNNYMFCHPENIEYRLDVCPIMHWQHVMLTSDMQLSIELRGSKPSKVILLQECRVLERVDIEHEVSRINSLFITVLDEWITFRWVSPQGNTQFQVRFYKLADCDSFIRSIEDSGVKISRKRKGIVLIDPNVDSRPANRKIHNYLSQSMSQSMSQSTSQNYDAQLESTQYSQNQDSLTQFSQSFAKQIKSYSQYSQTQYSQSAFDTDPFSLRLKSLRYRDNMDSLPSSASSNENLLSEDSFLANSIGSGCEGASSDILSLADCQSTHSAKTGRRIIYPDQPIKSLDIPALIRNNVPLNLKVEKYSFGSINPRSIQQKLVWRHLGLVSGLCLSLVPHDHNENPIVLLTRGTELIESFVPHPGYLKATHIDGVLFLERFNTDHHTTKSFVQLQMKDANVVASCQWLKEWMVKVDGDTSCFPATDTTYDIGVRTDLSSKDLSSKSCLFSDCSTMSRETRFWMRRDKKLGT